jgi:hypothetical protein
MEDEHAEKLKDALMMESFLISETRQPRTQTLISVRVGIIQFCIRKVI